MVQWLQHIPQNHGFQVSDDPTPLYKYRQPTIDIIISNHLTIRVKHIYVLIHYVHEEYAILNIDPVKLKPTI